MRYGKTFDCVLLRCLASDAQGEESLEVSRQIMKMTEARDCAENSEFSTLSSPTTSDSKRPLPKSKSKLKPNFSNPKTFVTLIAGKGSDTAEFIVHKEFACHYCQVLESAFNSILIEGQTQIYRFPEISGPVIQKLVQWFYSQDIVIRSLEEQVYKNSETRALIELWVLAAKLILQPLQNLVLRKLDLVRAYFAYENTAKGSLLRLFLVHRAAGMTRSYIDENPQRFSREMLVEMVVAMGNEHDLGDNHFGRESKWAQYEVSDSS
ncbi:uncharacterized protein RCO7_15045 [Rhynchosporium graminicola]|uniref:BTB domain-containing protein n=1 Tax=Rhynchosporium graminicola TaxID=2792576 RepID=A0A1E1LH98_9HELO|nr:uncharacterized protein RCO7_15045 [Rhynchosporium commune]